jgi:cytochrome oxidase Cu insertion factor (SCO1/SenC/PrrC family)
VEPRPDRRAVRVDRPHRETAQDKDFRGKLLLIYFGYTNCPDICPADLMQIRLAVNELGPAGESVHPLFITLDPDRDTAARLADYVPLFHPAAHWPNRQRGGDTPRGPPEGG